MQPGVGEPAFLCYCSFCRALTGTVSSPRMALPSSNSCTLSLFTDHVAALHNRDWAVSHGWLAWLQLIPFLYVQCMFWIRISRSFIYLLLLYIIIIIYYLLLCDPYTYGFLLFNQPEFCFFSFSDKLGPAGNSSLYNGHSTNVAMATLHS